MDYKSQLQLLRKTFNARALGKKVTVMTSPSGRGYHIYCDPPLTIHEAMMLGDCKGRIMYWQIQGYTFTFNQRLNWYGKTVGEEQPYNPLSLPFFSQIPRRWCKRQRKKKN